MVYRSIPFPPSLLPPSTLLTPSLLPPSLSSLPLLLPKVGCQVVAVLLHYLFMVTFMWMLMEGVVLYVALVQVFTKHQARYIAAFTIVSYGELRQYLADVAGSQSVHVYTKLYHLCLHLLLLSLLHSPLSSPLSFARFTTPVHGSDHSSWISRRRSTTLWL